MKICDTFMGCALGKTGVGVSRGIKLLFELRTMLDPSKVKVLNEEDPSETSALSQPSEIVDLSKNLHKQLLKLKGEFMEESGRVNYPKLRESPDYLKFQKDSAALKQVELTALSGTEGKAFFINIYNTLTVHALAQNVTDETTVLQLEKFWQMYAYRIGKLVFSLDDIEHGVLRCNQLHPTYKDYFFKEGDPRRTFVQEEVDPRIHFALNCGAKSCPPIRLFSVDNLDTALDMAARNFCQNDVSIKVDRNEVMVSKILMWYGGDFGSDEKAIAQRVFPYLSTEQQADLNKIKDNFKFVFNEYHWSIH